MKCGRVGLAASLFTILFIGAKVFAAEGVASDKPPTNDGLWVEVEPTFVQQTTLGGIYELIPYRNRREKWAQTISIGYSSFTPVNYEPNFIAAGFDEIYGSPSTPLLEIQYGVKRNFVFGAIGVDAGIGIYESSSSSDLIESSIELMPVRLGATLFLDTLTPEPYVVPYAFGGAYMMTYEEACNDVPVIGCTGEQTLGGNTDFALYYGAGVMFQLNWLDKESARISYHDYDIENSYIYAEGRQFQASSTLQDPDFSTGFDWGAGVRVEF